MFDQLLSAAMQKTNVRIDARNDLAVELEHKAQNAVGRRVLGPEIDGEIADSSFGHIGLTLAGGVQRPATPAGSETVATAEPLKTGVPKAFSQAELTLYKLQRSSKPGLSPELLAACASNLTCLQHIAACRLMSA